MVDVTTQAPTPIERHGPGSYESVRSFRGLGVEVDPGPRVLWVAGDEADPPHWRTGLERENVRVVGPLSPSCVRAALQGAESFDAAIIDVDSGDATYDAVLQLAEAQEPCRSVVVGSKIDAESVREAFLVGVVACLNKPVDARVLGAAVRQAIDGTVVMRRCIRAAIAPSSGPEPLVAPRVDLSMLTRREQEILNLLVEGRSTRKMAEQLSVTERTVRFHVSNLLRKLGAGSRVSLLAKLGRARAL